MFDDHLVRKQALLDYKILINKVATLDFIKVVILLFWLKKMEISSLFVVWQTKPENNVWWLYSTNAISDFGQKKLEISFLFVFGQERPRNNVW